MHMGKAPMKFFPSANQPLVWHVRVSALTDYIYLCSGERWQRSWTRGVAGRGCPHPREQHRRLQPTAPGGARRHPRWRLCPRTHSPTVSGHLILISLYYSKILKHCGEVGLTCFCYILFFRARHTSQWFLPVAIQNKCKLKFSFQILPQRRIESGNNNFRDHYHLATLEHKRLESCWDKPDTMYYLP